jgi:hypothetical protein
MLAKKPTVTFGADPEFFVQERATKTIIPACGLFGGEKGNPVILSKKGGYLEDGVTIEFNVAPSPTVVQVRTDLIELMALWHQRFPQHELVGTAAAEFGEGILKKHRQAMEIGCAADMSAWGVRRTPQVSDFGDVRFAGGHVHIGLDPWPEEFSKEFLVKWLDIFAFIPCVQSANELRFQYYGKPGLYRVTDYGVEYRTPDNGWVTGDKQFAVVSNIERVTHLLLNSERDMGDIQNRFAIIQEHESVGEFIKEPQDPHDCHPFQYPNRWRDIGKHMKYCVAY